MDCKVKFNMDNSAFNSGMNGIELARIFEDLAKKLNSVSEDWNIGDSLNIRDINGNTIGKITFTK